MQLAATTNAPTEGGHARVRDPKRKAQVHTTTSQYTVDLAREVSLHWLAGPSIAAGEGTAPTSRNSASTGPSAPPLVVACVHSL